MLAPVFNRPFCAVAILGCAFSLFSTRVVADEKIAICHAGLITLPSFEQHVADFHRAKRVQPERNEKLAAQRGSRGSGFFTSLLISQEQSSGSGTYDLRL